MKDDLFPRSIMDTLELLLQKQELRFYQRQFVVSLSSSMVLKKLSLCFLVMLSVSAAVRWMPSVSGFSGAQVLCVLPVVAVYQGMLFNPVLALKKTQNVQGKFKTLPRPHLISDKSPSSIQVKTPIGIKGGFFLLNWGFGYFLSSFCKPSALLSNHHYALSVGLNILEFYINGL